LSPRQRRYIQRQILKIPNGYRLPCGYIEYKHGFVRVSEIFVIAGVARIGGEVLVVTARQH
jgi:hypothetical protein